MPPLCRGIKGAGSTTGEKREDASSWASPFPSGELGRAVGPRGAWGEGAPDFLPEASWKRAALRAPGASSAGVGPSGAGGSRGGSARRPVLPRLRGVPSLRDLEALLSEYAGRESNYYVEKNLNLEHAPSLCPNPGPIFTRRFSQWPTRPVIAYAHMHTDSHTHLHRQKSIHSHAQNVYSHNSTCKPNATQPFNIYAFLGVCTLSP